ncbi:hypothetical protein P3H15_44365 [Rhodococcus sp. T2V]|uniref:hypothetical protein n=1 Tax=Rhodococcus sp. T2V TaxID=3034164 RepID=UPI0023E33706|nr:hypothetical protein [Rhodococcus sp. T2V]MDF3312013.1 hypothetical protein [Rhodococcus sp. T2V]
MACNPHPGSGHPDYEQVLEWVVQAITDVVVARLGSAPPGQQFTLAIHRRNGDEVDPAHLPKSRDWVLRTAGMFPADDPESGRERLEAARRHPDPVQRGRVTSRRRTRTRCSAAGLDPVQSGDDRFEADLGPLCGDRREWWLRRLDGGYARK